MTSTAPAGRRWLALAFVALALALAACGGSDASVPTATATASVTEGPSDLEQQLAESGLQDLASVIKVVQLADAQALANRIEFSNRPCSAALDPGSEPGCAFEVVSSPSGTVRRYTEREGTLVEVFPFAACNLEWRREDALQDVFDWVDGAEPLVYAVFEAPEGRQLPGDYVAVFASEGRQFGYAVYTRGDRVTAVAQGCSPGPASLVPVDMVDFIVEPPRPERPEPQPTATNARVVTDNLNVRLGPGLDYSVVGQLNTGADLDILGRSVDGEWLAIEGAGWVFWNPEWIELDVTLPSLAALHVANTFGTIGDLHAEGEHLGVEAVDAVIDAVTSGDPAAIEAQFSYLSVPCTSGRPGPPCGNLAPGTPTDAIKFVACEGEFVRRGSPAVAERLLARANGATAIDALRLYLVVETPDEANAEYGVLFAFDSDPHAGRLVLVGRGGGIVSVVVGCGDEVPAWMLRLIDGPAIPVLLPPRPTSLDPAPQ